MKNYRFSVVVEKDRDGYFAFCPELQGCYTQGATHDEALENMGLQRNLWVFMGYILRIVGTRTGQHGPEITSHAVSGVSCQLATL